MDLRPLQFLHIPKTGGTSFVHALGSYYAPKDILSDNGNLSLAFLQSHADRLGDPVFLHGHPLDNVMAILGDRAQSITILRRPRDQAISN